MMNFAAIPPIIPLNAPDPLEIRSEMTWEAKAPSCFTYCMRGKFFASVIIKSADIEEPLAGAF